MNLFLNTAYNFIEIYVFKVGYEKLYKIESINDHTEKLYDLLAEILKKELIKLTDIKEIYVVNGPGSFTGVRIGVLFAKTLAYENNILLTPVNYLTILYETNKKRVAIDGRSNSFFIYDGEKTAIMKEEELKGNYLIDPKINYKYLVSNLENYSPQEPQKVKIEYLKSPV